MPFTFIDTKPTVSDDDMIADLRRVAHEDASETVTVRRYNEYGRFASAAIKSRFGSWNAALNAAGLATPNIHRLADEALWDNLRSVWIHLGRQPRRSEMMAPLSRFTHNPYVRRFGSWLQAMKAFVASAQQEEVGELTEPPMGVLEARSGRTASLRLRYFVMRRDSFRCIICGRSPATHAGVELHLITRSRGRTVEQPPPRISKPFVSPATLGNPISR
jgi:hypothetical protein